MKTFILIVLTIIFAPLLGLLLSGFDRIITARLQGRQGPPLSQPYYDLIKLFYKERLIASKLQVFYAVVYLVLSVTALCLFVLGEDLLLIVFIMAFAACALVLGALSVKSPYSQIGAHREIMQILAYEPVLILTAIMIYLVTGSFKVSDIVAFQVANNQPLIYTLPLLFIALTYVLTVKLRKSPFDISTSHHAHQELVKGITTEYSGPYLAIVEVAHLYEIILVLGLVGLFWANNWILALGLIVVAFLLELILDNTTSRMTWRWMLKSTWIGGAGLAIANLVGIYLIK